MKTEMVLGNRLLLRLKIEVVVLMKCHEQQDPDRKAHFVAFVDRGKTEKFKVDLYRTEFWTSYPGMSHHYLTENGLIFSQCSCWKCALKPLKTSKIFFLPSL